MKTDKLFYEWLQRLRYVFIVSYMGLTVSGYSSARCDKVFILSIIVLFLLELIGRIVSHWTIADDPLEQAPDLLDGVKKMESALAPDMHWAQAFCLEYHADGWKVFLLWTDDASPTGLSFTRIPLDKVLETLEREEKLSSVSFGPGEPYDTNIYLKKRYE